MVCSNSFCCWLVDGWGTMTAAVVGCGCDRVVGRMTKLKQIWKVGILCCRLRRELVGGVSNESLSRSDLSPSTASPYPSVAAAVGVMSVAIDNRYSHGRKM